MERKRIRRVLLGAGAGKMVGGMAAPFVKAATASATALVAGPAGAVAGGAAGGVQIDLSEGLLAGVAVDMAIGKGLELVQREDFEKEVVRAVTATRDEYFRVLEAPFNIFQLLSDP